MQTGRLASGNRQAVNSLLICDIGLTGLTANLTILEAAAADRLDGGRESGREAAVRHAGRRRQACSHPGRQASGLRLGSKQPPTGRQTSSSARQAVELQQVTLR